MEDNGGWDASADAWIASIGQDGDWTRRTVLDAVMLERAVAAGGRFIDIGCGEGRFVRMLQEKGLNGCGIDPVPRLLERARECDPQGDYRLGKGEQLDFDDASFDLSIAYLSLIDIPDFRSAITEMVRITKPGGRLLIANLTGHFSAGRWQKGLKSRFVMDHYSEERPSRERWAGIDVINWHRPLHAYMQAFLAHGLVLTWFDEPTPLENTSDKHDRYTRVPGFLVMEWQKPI
ncbi:MAG: methyltransferase domain-containing protein [Pseudomonadota bacterium]